MVTGCRFDFGRTLLALEWSYKVHWMTVTDEADIFLLYNLEAGLVFPVPSYNQGIREWPSVGKLSFTALATLKYCICDANEFFSSLFSVRLRPFGCE